MVPKPVGVPVLGGTAAATVGTVQQDDAIVVERGSTGALEPAAAKADDTNKDLTGELVQVPRPLLPAEVSSSGESEEGSEEEFTSEGEDEGVQQPPPATPAEQQEAIDCLVRATFNDNPAGRKFITNLVSENSGQPLDLRNLLTVVNMNFMGEDSTVSIQTLLSAVGIFMGLCCLFFVLQR